MSQPVNGTETPFATANDVMTQVPWSELTPRSPLIVGMDTFAIEVSSTCMNVPRARATAVTALLAPLSVGASATVAALALMAPRSGAACDLGGAVAAADAAEPGGLVRLRACVVRDDLRDAGIHRRVIARARLRGQRRVAEHRGHYLGTRRVVQIHAHAGGQTDAQRVRLELRRIEENAYRNALHDLDPVARGVLRRQERECAAAARRDADQPA